MGISPLMRQTKLTYLNIRLDLSQNFFQLASLIDSIAHNIYSDGLYVKLFCSLHQDLTDKQSVKDSIDDVHFSMMRFIKSMKTSNICDFRLELKMVNEGNKMFDKNTACMKKW